MRRYILFGSRNEIAQSFIRLARSRNHRILCLHPYKTPGPNYINYNFLLTSLGGIPLRYSFRDEFTGEHGYHQIKALVSMLKGVDGVVWAAHPLRGETTWSEKREERVKEYMEDLRSLLAVMKIGKKRTFVCLSIAPQRHEAEGKVMGENEGIMTQEAQELEKLEENMVDLMSRMKTLDWTVVRVSYPENELEDLHADGSGEGHIPGEGRQRYIEWVNDVAKTVMDTLEYGISKRIVEVNSKSAYNEEEFRIENVEALPALEHASQATSVIQSTHSPEVKIPASPHQIPSLLHSALFHADPVLSSINPLTFPQHFSKQSESNASMTKLLEDIRSGREHNTSELHTEQKRNEELRRQRELTRLAAQKKGLPPPGADVRMLQRVYASTSLKPKISNSWKRTAINLHLVDGKYAPTAAAVQSATKTEAKTATMQSSSVQDRWENSSDSRYRETLEDKREGLFETLADVLLDRSTDRLTPQLASPSGAWQNFEFHPRWQYSASRLGKKQRR